MARSVSAEFKALWQKKSGVIERRRLRVYRRYHNGSAFVNEATPTDFYEDDFVSIGDVPWTVDPQFQNVYLAPVVTFHFNNERNQWRQATVPPSFFAADNAATGGYRLYKTIIEAQTAYKLRNGTLEWVTVFTGYVLGPKLGSRPGTAAIRAISKAALLLEKSDAAQVSETFTLENCIPAVGDAANKDFESTSKGVDHLTDFQVGGVSQSFGADAVVSNTNRIQDPNNTGRAAIKTNAAPASLATVKCSGRKWYQNQSIETIIGLLCDEAGVAAAQRSIEPVILPAAAGFKQIDSQAEWQAGSATDDVDLAGIAGSCQPFKLIDNFADGDYSASPVWTVKNQTGPAYATAVAGTPAGYLELFSGSNILSWIALQTPYTRSTGLVGRFKVNPYSYSGPGSSSGGTGAVVMFFQTQDVGSSGGQPLIKGYGLRFNLDQGGGNSQNQVELMRYDNEFVSGGTVLASLGTFVVGDAVWEITRDGSGNFVVYKDGTQLGTATDNTYTVNAQFALAAQTINSSAAIGLRVTEIRHAASLNPAYESQEFDLLAAPSFWGALDATQTLNGWTITLATNVATTSGGAYDGYVNVNGSSVPTSSLKRYVKIRATFSASGSARASLPELQKLRLNFSTTNLFLALAKHAGLTGLAAIEKYATATDYETGDDPDGKRFFRAKDTSGAPVVTLTQENGIIEIVDWDDGADRVANVGRVRSGPNGEYLEEYDGASAGEASPTSEEEYGRTSPSAVELDLTDLLLANDVNIAAARAQLEYERGYRKKIRIRARIWVVPWLEAGDKARLTLVDDPLHIHVVAGDPLPRAGSARLSLDGTPGAAFAVNLDMKTLEYKPNYDTNIAEALFEEVL